MVNRDIPLRSVPIFSRTNGCRLEFEQSIFYLFPAGQEGYRYSIRSNTVNASCASLFNLYRLEPIFLNRIRCKYRTAIHVEDSIEIKMPRSRELIAS